MAVLRVPDCYIQVLGKTHCGKGTNKGSTMVVVFNRVYGLFKVCHWSECPN